jgi:hypothetical protein
MSKENLFELIRREEVVIWAGAGFSMYAGYPSANELASKIYNSLLESEKKHISPHLPLPDLAEEYNRTKGSRHPLYKILIDIFLHQNPKNIKYHQMLAGIPHIKTIITTNYDRLFELAYGAEGQKITHKNISYIDSNKVHIFKVHGDLEDLDSVVLTKTDYLKFIEGELNTIYWSIITERIATKNILFLGFSLEDTNILALYDKVKKAQGGHMRQAFLVAPELPNHKVNDLIKRDINYINATGQELIEELNSEIRSSIIEDLNNNIIKAETFHKYFKLNNLIPDLKGNDNGFRLKSIQGKDGKIFGKMNFNFTNLENKKSFQKEFEDILSGKLIKDLVLPGEILDSFEYSVSGIKIPSGFQKDMDSKVTIKRAPSKEYIVDIRFNDGYEVTNIPVKLYNTKHLILVELKYKHAEISFQAERKASPTIDLAVKFDHGQIFKKTKDEIEVYTLFKNFVSGVGFVVSIDKGFTFNLNPAKNQESLAYANWHIKYFENLKKVEQHYGVRFNGYTDISVESEFTLKRLIQAIKGDPYLRKNWKEQISFDHLKVNDKLIKDFTELHTSQQPIVVQHYETEELYLHGQKINLGYSYITVLEPYVINFADMINKKEAPIIKSRINTIWIEYRDYSSEESSVRKL